MAENLIEAINYEITLTNPTTATSPHSYCYLYKQANSQSTWDGYKAHIYRTPNHDGLAQQGHGWDNYGGLVLRPIYINDSILQKGHRYCIRFHCSGQTNDATSFGWTNNAGWGGGGLTPSPSNTLQNGIPANFQGERECYYLFTINDDVYKTCTSSYSSFVAGTIYPSYRDFTVIWNYSVTGELGTDLYLSNFAMYDITSLSTFQLEITKKGQTKLTELIERLDSENKTSIEKNTGNLYSPHIIEY